jgi:hypothetical protein
MMNTNEIVRQLQTERDKLDAAINALQGLSGGDDTRVRVVGKRRGRPPGSANQSNQATAKSANKSGMSAAARKRIADAMRKRWAAAKKSGKKKL